MFHSSKCFLNWLYYLFLYKSVSQKHTIQTSVFSSLNSIVPVYISSDIWFRLGVKRVQKMKTWKEIFVNDKNIITKSTVPKMTTWPASVRHLRSRSVPAGSSEWKKNVHTFSFHNLLYVIDPFRTFSLSKKKLWG